MQEEEKEYEQKRLEKEQTEAELTEWENAKRLERTGSVWMH